MANHSREYYRQRYALVAILERAEECSSHEFEEAIEDIRRLAVEGLRLEDSNGD
jgi:hypothetical protein